MLFLEWPLVRCYRLRSGHNGEKNFLATDNTQGFFVCKSSYIEQGQYDPHLAHLVNIINGISLVACSITAPIGKEGMVQCGVLMKVQALSVTYTRQLYDLYIVSWTDTADNHSMSMVEWKEKRQQENHWSVQNEHSQGCGKGRVGCCRVQVTARD